MRGSSPLCRSTGSWLYPQHSITQETADDAARVCTRATEVVNRVPDEEKYRILM